MTSPAINNNVRHIDVSDVIAADFRLPDGHPTPAQVQAMKTMVGNGSAGRHPASERARRPVNNVVECPAADDVFHAADLTGLTRCDGGGCGRHDNASDDHGKASAPVSTASHSAH